jgi:Tfp pilus assembly protein PilO
MNKLKGLFLQLLPFLILAYNGFIFYESYEEHLTKVENLTNQVSALEAKTRKAETDVKKISKFKEDLEKSKERVEKVNQQIVTVQKQLPSEANDTEVLQFLDEEAKLMNFQNISIAPKEEVSQGFYYSKKYSFAAQGTYLQFMIYFERLQNAERLYNVERVTFKSDGVKQKGRFTLIQCDTTIETFRYNPNHKEASGVEEIESKYKI